MKLHAEIQLLKKEIAANKEDKCSLGPWIFDVIGKMLDEEISDPSELPGVGMKILGS